jgi:CotH kinase protein
MLSKKIVTALLSIVYTFSFGQNLYNPSTVKDIKLTFPRADYDAFLDSVKSKGGDARLKGSMTIDGQKFDEIGVRYKGNSSYFGTRKKGINKFPFNVKLKKKDKIEGKYNTLKLSNVNRDASFIREALSYEIVRTYMPAPLCNYARVYVNEKMMGFYNNVEAVDDQFIKNHFDFPKNNEGWLVKCDPEWTAEESKTCPKGDKASLMYLGEDSTCYRSLYDVDKDGNWKEFIQFVKTLNQEPEKIERILNVDQTLWMLALNNILVNLDSYNGLFCHNYYLMRGADGRFTPLMWDLNLSFGGFVYDGVQAGPLSIEQLQTLQPLQHLDNPKRPLVAQVLKIPMYRKIYLAHVKTILADWFTNGKYLQKGKEIAQLIDNEVNEDKNKHYSYDEFKQNLTKSVGNPKENVIGIEELMKARIAFLNAHPLLQKAQPKIEAKPTPSVLDEKMTVKVKVTGATRVWFVNRSDKNGVFRYAPMLDDGLHNDDAAGDGVYGVVIDKKAYLQYFINAEGEESVSLLPERAAHEFFEWKGF